MTNGFEAFRSALTDAGTHAALDCLIASLRNQKKFHELFEALKFRLRQRLGMRIIPAFGAQADEALSSEYESGLLEACRDVGFALLGEGRLREAWMYLRPLGDSASILAALDTMPVTDERIDEVIEVCLYEGLDPVRAFRLMLEKYGTCNTLTTYDAQQRGLSLSARQQIATLLVQHLYDQLLHNVRVHIEREENSLPAGGLAELVASRAWLTANGGYHIDTSHLASTVRAARVLNDHTALQLAWELADYGSRLEPSLQYADEEPFVEIYRAHCHYFDILLGRNRDVGLKYFCERAKSVDAHYDGTGAIEVYVDLLLRVGQYREAFEFALHHLPPGTHTRGIAPPLIEIARLAGESERVAELFCERDDLLGYAAALLQKSE